GVAQPSWTWRVVLPVGISFYTFQSLGYTIDVYRRHIEPCRDPVAFLAFVSFFPQLVAGPIERASHLLPQFLQTRIIRLADVEAGFWLVLWGLFKKVVVADQLAPVVELAFDRGAPSGPLLLVGTFAFAGQIYGDFSGYSDVARGLAQALGFDLMRNFDRPYASANVREFWRRWHISLSTWIRDYLYVPLGGNRGSEARVTLNLLVTFLVAGLWHGASWNFVLWGVWHGLALAVHRAWSRRPGSALPVVAGRVLTLLTVGYGWLLFRAVAPGSLVRLHGGLLAWSAPAWIAEVAIVAIVWSVPLLVAESDWGRRLSPTTFARLPAFARGTVAGLVVLGLAAYWERDAVPFIYFQF
ncbi:MAG: MBOAT family protein, partial [Verrucomicrobiales bacterium]|nr:MBOAT family protein [Verrucomicrobiales bacterium]